MTMNLVAIAGIPARPASPSFGALPGAPDPSDTLIAAAAVAVGALLGFFITRQVQR
jgi:hypothetical protein